MFIQDMALMYVQRPDDFWILISAIAPIFINGLAWGVLLQSREFHGKTLSWRGFHKGLLLINITGTVWFCYSNDWYPTNMEQVVELLLVMLLLMIPLLGGAMTGIKALMAYCFISQLWSKAPTKRN